MNVNDDDWEILGWKMAQTTGFMVWFLDVTSHREIIGDKCDVNDGECDINNEIMIKRWQMI